MYLKEMGNVELLSRTGEIEIAKELKMERRIQLMHSQKALFPWKA